MGQGEMHRNRGSLSSLSPPSPTSAYRERIHTGREGGGGQLTTCSGIVQQVFIERLTYARLWPDLEMWT